MTTTIVTKPLKLAGVIALASLPVIWWAADRADQFLHVATCAAVFVVTAVAAYLLRHADPAPGLDAARRTAIRFSLLIGLVYLWGAAAILVSYYLTDLSWYHAWQYPIYLAIPGLISLYVAKRHRRPVSSPEITRDLDIGRWMAWVQLVVMLGVMVYMWFSREVAMGLAGENSNWPAVDIMLFGTLAVAILSWRAVVDDRRLRGGAAARPVPPSPERA